MHAAINKRSDRLSGLKENVIIGKLLGRFIQIKELSYWDGCCHWGKKAIGYLCVE